MAKFLARICLDKEPGRHRLTGASDHQVPKQRSDEDRYCIGTECLIFGCLGKHKIIFSLIMLLLGNNEIVTISNEDAI